MYQALERNLRTLLTGSSQRPRKQMSRPLASYFVSCPYARLGWWVRHVWLRVPVPVLGPAQCVAPIAPSIRPRRLGYVVSQDACTSLRGWSSRVLSGPCARGRVVTGLGSDCVRRSADSVW